MTRAVLLVAILFAGCESPTAPSAVPIAPPPAPETSYPQVAGTYRGWITLSVEGSSFGPDIGTDESLTFVVTQDGRTVTLAGTKSGVSGTRSWSNLTRPIGDDGHLQRLGLPRNQDSSTCGLVEFTSFRIWFSESRLHYELDATSPRCGIMRWRARLPKVR